MGIISFKKGAKDMNVLFLTVSTGHGHTSCARALEEYLKENGANTYFLDIYGYIKPFLSKAVSDIYLFASGKTPKLYGKYYDKEDMGKTKFKLTALPKSVRLPAILTTMLILLPLLNRNIPTLAK